MKLLRDNFGVKRVALLYDITNDSTVLEPQIVKTWLVSLAIRVVADEAFRGNDVDFRSQLTKIKGQ